MTPGIGHTQEKPPQRARRWFWVIGDDDFIRHVEGQACDGSPDLWWVPNEGSTCRVGYHIFDTEDQARRRLVENLLDRKTYIEKALVRLGA